MKRLAIAAVAGLLAACSLAPEYHEPVAPVPQAWAEGQDWRPAQPADEQPRGNWWAIYGDTGLDALEQKLGNANADLQAAYAHYRQARADAGAVRAARLPTIGAQAGASRRGDSANTARGAGPVSTYNDYRIEADVSYEIDLWGRVRNSASAARALEQSSAGELAALNLSLQVELARNYFALRGLDRELGLVETSITAYERALELTQNRYKAGIAAAADIDQAQTLLESTRAEAADLHLRRARAQHAIAVLVGETASGFQLPPADWNAAPPEIDPGLPSVLLQRRPDIAAAERRVAAANDQIGVARAAWFPVFSIGGALGYESASGGSWFDAPSRLWALGPAAALTVFDGGRRRALSDKARAAYDEAAADYRQTVLDAWREVEDELAARRLLLQEAGNRDAAAAAAGRALEQAQNRYKGGLVSYLEVVSAQTTSLQAQRAELDVSLRRLDSSLLLIKALGGGWRRQGDDFAAPSPDNAAGESRS